MRCGVTTRNVLNRLLENGIHVRGAVACSQFTPAHNQMRVQCTHSQKLTLCCSLAISICARYHWYRYTGQVDVCLASIGKLHPSFKYGTILRSIVKGGISYNNKTTLFTLNIMTANIYVGMVIEPLFCHSLTVFARCCINILRKYILKKKTILNQDLKRLTFHRLWCEMI